MAILKIITIPDPVLRQKARKISRVTPAIQTLIDDMVETMRAAPGVGLAAPQVNVSERLIVVEYGEGSDDPEDPGKDAILYTLVNPEITRRSRTTDVANEGCLSIPGYVGDVERHETVTVKALNRQGDKVKIKAKGWLARILQHEIDHLDGILFIDRAIEMYRVEGPESGAAA